MSSRCKQVWGKPRTRCSMSNMIYYILSRGRQPIYCAI